MAFHALAVNPFVDLQVLAAFHALAVNLLTAFLVPVAFLALVMGQMIGFQVAVAFLALKTFLGVVEDSYFAVRMKKACLHIVVV